MQLPWEISTRTASSIWRSLTLYDDTVSILLGNGDGTFCRSYQPALGKRRLSHCGG